MSILGLKCARTDTIPNIIFNNRLAFVTRMNVHSLPRFMGYIADKKVAIFASTLALIKEHGFRGASMGLVAKNADVAVGTIYHYFESKDQLICELYTYNRNKIVDILNAVIDKKSSYKENFFRIWMHIYEFYIQNTDVLIFFEHFMNSPYYVNKYPDHSQDQPLYNFFAEGIKNGPLKVIRPEILLMLTLGSINSMAKLNMFENKPLSTTELKQIVEMLWNSITMP